MKKAIDSAKLVYYVLCVLGTVFSMVVSIIFFYVPLLKKNKRHERP